MRIAAPNAYLRKRRSPPQRLPRHSTMSRMILPLSSLTAKACTLLTTRGTLLTPRRGFKLWWAAGSRRTLMTGCSRRSYRAAPTRPTARAAASGSTAASGEPTWELREALEDAGWIPQLERRKLRTGPTVRLDFPELIESFFAKDDAELAKVIEKGGCTVRSYTRMNPKYAQRFYSAWQELQTTHVPIIVYHSTLPVNFPSIYRMGLVVGGASGEALAYGSAYGRGVFTARTASAVAFDSSIIACAGLVPMGKVPKGGARMGSVYCTGDFVIFSDPTHVYPMWLVQTDGTTPEGGVTLCPGAPPFLERQIFYTNACSGFGKHYFISPHAVIIGVHPAASTVIDKIYGSSAADCLTEDEAKEAARALRSLVVSGAAGGNSFSKAALKAQPRRVKELLARLRR